MYGIKLCKYRPLLVSLSPREWSTRLRDMEIPIDQEMNILSFTGHTLVTRLEEHDKKLWTKIMFTTTMWLSRLQPDAYPWNGLQLAAIGQPG